MTKEALLRVVRKTMHQERRSRQEETEAQSHVLCIDDSAVIRKQAKKALEGSGFRVATAESAESGLQVRGCDARPRAGAPARSRAHTC